MKPLYIFKKTRTINIFVLTIILALAGLYMHLQNQGTKNLISSYEYRIVNLELNLKKQSKDINDCMNELPNEKSNEIYKKHREELGKEVEKYLNDNTK